MRDTSIPVLLQDSHEFTGEHCFTIPTLEEDDDPLPLLSDGAGSLASFGLIREYAIEWNANIPPPPTTHNEPEATPSPSQSVTDSECCVESTAQDVCLFQLSDWQPASCPEMPPHNLLDLPLIILLTALDIELARTPYTHLLPLSRFHTSRAAFMAVKRLRTNPADLWGMLSASAVQMNSEVTKEPAVNRLKNVGLPQRGRAVKTATNVLGVTEMVFQRGSRRRRGRQRFPLPVEEVADSEPDDISFGDGYTFEIDLQSLSPREASEIVSMLKPFSKTSFQGPIKFRSKLIQNSFWGKRMSHRLRNCTIQFKGIHPSQIDKEVVPTWGMCWKWLRSIPQWRQQVIQMVKEFAFLTWWPIPQLNLSSWVTEGTIGIIKDPGNCRDTDTAPDASVVVVVPKPVPRYESIPIVTPEHLVKASVRIWQHVQRVLIKHFAYARSGDHINHMIARTLEANFRARLNEIPLINIVDRALFGTDLGEIFPPVFIRGNFYINWEPVLSEAAPLYQCSMSARSLIAPCLLNMGLQATESEEEPRTIAKKRKTITRRLAHPSFELDPDGDSPPIERYIITASRSNEFVDFTDFKEDFTLPKAPPTKTRKLIDIIGLYLAWCMPSNISVRCSLKPEFQAEEFRDRLALGLVNLIVCIDCHRSLLYSMKKHDKVYPWSCGKCKRQLSLLVPGWSLVCSCDREAFNESDLKCPKCGWQVALRPDPNGERRWFDSVWPASIFEFAGATFEEMQVQTLANVWDPLASLMALADKVAAARALGDNSWSISTNKIWGIKNSSVTFRITQCSDSLRLISGRPIHYESIADACPTLNFAPDAQEQRLLWMLRRHMKVPRKNDSLQTRPRATTTIPKLSSWQARRKRVFSRITNRKQAALTPSTDASPESTRGFTSVFGPFGTQSSRGSNAGEDDSSSGEHSDPSDRENPEEYGAHLIDGEQSDHQNPEHQSEDERGDPQNSEAPQNVAEQSNLQRPEDLDLDSSSDDSDPE